MIIVLDYMVWYVRLINKKTVLFLTCFILFVKQEI